MLLIDGESIITEGQCVCVCVCVMQPVYLNADYWARVAARRDEMRINEEI